jgi:hypothetical protein
MFWASVHVTHPATADPPQIDYVIPSQPSSCTTRPGSVAGIATRYRIASPKSYTLRGYAPFANSINSARRTHTNALNTPLVPEKRQFLPYINTIWFNSKSNIFLTVTAYNVNHSTDLVNSVTTVSTNVIPDI